MLIDFHTLSATTPPQTPNCIPHATEVHFVWAIDQDVLKDAFAQAQGEMREASSRKLSQYSVDRAR